MCWTGGRRGGSARHLVFSSFISELLLLLLMAPPKSGAVPWSDRITYEANRLQEHLRSLFHFQVAAGFSISVWKLVCFQALPSSGFYELRTSDG